MTTMSRQADLLHERLPDNAELIVLNRPQSRNAVSFAMWDGFAAALDDIERAATASAIIVAGADNFFCAGGDIKTSPARGSGALSYAARLELAHSVMVRLRRTPLPTIAAVEGKAIGIGWSLACSCDLVIASREATFAAPFLKRDMVPDGGLAWHLAQRLGRHAAAELLFSGRSITAAEALGLGLVSRICEPGETLAEAQAFVGANIAGHAHASELTKRLLHRADAGGLDAVLDLELAYFQLRKPDTPPV